MNHRSVSRAIALATVVCALASCSRAPERVVGTDEHGNAVSARITVVDESGEPIPGVMVSLRPRLWLDGEALDTVSSQPDGADATSGEDGSCQIRYGSSNEHRILSARHDGLGASFLGPSTSLGNRVLVLRPTGSVQGSVAEGGPGLPVRVAGIPGITWTDDSGRFSLSDLPVGVHRLEIGAGSVRTVAESMPVGAGQATILPTLPAPGVVDTAVSVAKASSAPLPGVPVFVPEAGTYTTPPTIEVRTADSSATVEVSTDGRVWEPVMGTLHPFVSICLFARSTNAEGVVSRPERACYVIQP